ncbi:MAG TPA: outer membrane lipoprotein carrier protein LolA [Candidatus Polarisedimenticolia bacterium]|jgi:outer membrane lipoprotein carrier protein
MLMRAILLSWTLLVLPAQDADPLLALLQRKLDGLTALKGRFIQTLDTPSLGRPRTEEGRLAFKKPALMRWDYEKPEPKVAVADGRHTWLYTPADRQVKRGSVRDLQEEGAAALLLAGRISLVKDFRSRRPSAEESGPPGVSGGVTVELTPLKPNQEFAKLILVIDPVRLQIRSLTVAGAAGERMVFDLFDLEENPDLPDDLFRFEIPVGAEVLEDR